MGLIGSVIGKALSVANVYICPECGHKMIFETSDSLLCEKCGYGVDYDKYGLTDEEYENLYPTEDEYLSSIGEYHGENEEDIGDGEYYDPDVDGMYDND